MTNKTVEMQKKNIFSRTGTVFSVVTLVYQSGTGIGTGCVLPIDK